jgi:LAS superfamily LD-carboxypeptidase LdcB
VKKNSWLLTLIIPVACASCVSDLGGDDDEEHEDEPSASSADELRSAVSCAEKSATGYKSGSPYAMKVITVGGKSTEKKTAHAFLKMQQAADAAGVSLSINSGFRTQAEQQYFYKCYQTRACNNGNLAARPGYSNHQNGRALDLATSNWTWVANNAGRFGFKKTVPSERWHYEFFGNDPGGPCAGGNTPPGPVGNADEDAASATPPSSTPSTAGCWSPTMNKTMPAASCVQSSADDVYYQCNGGQWYRGVANGKGPYGTCSSTHAN